MVNPLKKSREFVISSLSTESYKIEKFVEEICDLFNINNTYFGNILIAVNEVVKNAVKHGNKELPGTRVTLKFTPQPRGLSFSIKDEGKGFDHHSIPDPLQVNDDNYDTIGKGIFLMSKLVDLIMFNKKGNQVELFFKISSINYETSLHRVKALKKYFQKEKKLA